MKQIMNSNICRSSRSMIMGGVRRYSTLSHPKAKSLLSPVWSHGSDIVVDKANGAWIWDTNGNKYLDFTCGIGVTNLGHCHPRIVKAVQHQVSTRTSQYSIPPTYAGISSITSEIIHLSDTDRYFFSNSGAEAIEASIKLARHATNKTNIITFEGSFHGRTIGTMSLTNSKTIYRVGYQPLMPGVFVSPFSYPVRLVECEILVEPILGEGGYVPATEPFLRGLRKICDHNGILLIFDEVQSGFGRTGKWFAFEHYGIVPDILVMAKGIANGFPLSGIAAREELHKKWKTGSHGGTYGGNAVSCAAAVETIKIFHEENVLDNVKERSEELVKELKEIKSKFPIITDVRGKGLMIGMEFNGKAKGIASKITNACLHNGMLLLTAGPDGRYEAVRFIPPLTVNRHELNTGIQIFKKALNSVLTDARDL